MILVDNSLVVLQLYSTMSQNFINITSSLLNIVTLVEVDPEFITKITSSS